MKMRWMKWLGIPAELEQDFMEEAVRVNGVIMTAVSLFAVAVEIINVIRVLFLTSVGLGTLNNRIYFSFYLVLLLIGCAYLAAGRWTGLTLKARYWLMMAAGSIFLLWQTLFNMYDMGRSVSPGKIAAVTTLVAFSALGVMKPWYALLNLAVNFSLLIPYLFTVCGKDAGLAFNYILTAGICVVIYSVRFHDIRRELVQEREIRDISRQLEESREQFRLSSAQYELILQKSHLIAFEWNVESGEVRFSEEWVRVFGQESRIPDAERFIREGSHIRRQARTELLLCMENLQNGMPYQKRDLLLPVAGGAERWFELHLIRQAGENGKPALGIGMLLDIMDQKQRTLELEKELQQDPFTRLLNKTAMESYGVRKLEELQAGERMYMLILDMDHFKRINDSFGHPCGDYVLGQVAELMKGLAPEGSRVGRLGGDEFGVILATERRGDAFLAYAEGLVEKVRQIRWQGNDVQAGCSIGIAALRPREGSWMKLYNCADQALYQAKRSGRNCVRFYETGVPLRHGGKIEK